MPALSAKPDQKLPSTALTTWVWPWSMALAPTIPLAQQFVDYWVDALQRNILVLDVLRRRGNQYIEQQKDPDPSILYFDTVILIDGRTLLFPVNYQLHRVLPPDGIETDPRKRPFVVFDPRAGHGPGMSGMKPESEIGMALKQGHPVYWVSFLPMPVKGQTSQDVCQAEAVFISKIIEWHPHADKPCLIGNCQAGWQIAIMSAMEPDLPGVLILAGAPLSYWTGAHGSNHMRYMSGVTGGSWPVALTCDLGNGIFDGAHLVDSFEKNNPSNTYLRKPYALYTKIDSEAPRFLEFERWWNNPVYLGREEMHFVSDDLFIGNHLVEGRIQTSNGIRVDLRNIHVPIVIFCSQADDITSPQQALGWLLDLYGCDDDILANEQTIIYSMHEYIGHLGLFVSAAIAGKEHQKFISTIDMIEMLPPGLFEARFVSKDEEPHNAEYASGDFILRFERRSLEDIRALGVNDREDDMRFATVARLSENIQGLYYTCLSPFIQALSSPETAKLIHQTHPIRLQVLAFSDNNPWMALLGPLQKWAESSRAPLKSANLFWDIQEEIATITEHTLKQLDACKNTWAEGFFLAFYGWPLLQAMVGLHSVRPYIRHPLDKDLQSERERKRRLVHLLETADEGGLPEAVIRGLFYIARAEHMIDEREYRLVLKLREESSLFPALSQEELRTMARKQYMLLVLDEDKTLRAIPTLLKNTGFKAAQQAFDLIKTVVQARHALSTEEQKRLSTLAHLFTVKS
ncbi:MAG: DUF3141 domain-containing protein [Proteobacteria bacterium]|jgi:hypothetical protein|nr:DUF3141 domain-containing protein [Alphaproteobacteria bacterium]NCC04191.1 DUF3141 domain-containing protein [Pseudomonadota bacterium]